MEEIQLSGRAPNILPVSTTPVEEPEPEPDEDISDDEPDEELDFQPTADLPSVPISAFEPETPEEKKLKRQTINKIRKYKELFGQSFAEINTSNLWERSLSDLTNLLENIEFCVQVRQSGKHSRSIFLQGLAIWEVVGKKLKLNLEGLTLEARNNEQLMETVDECAIKYSDDVAIDPLYRLLMGIGELSIAQHTVNTARVGKPIANEFTDGL
jgi:hypothetical protein